MLQNFPKISCFQPSQSSENRGRLFNLKNNLHKSLIFQLQSFSPAIFSSIPKKKSYRRRNMSKRWPRICRKELTKRQWFWTQHSKVFPTSELKIHYNNCSRRDLKRSLGSRNSWISQNKHWSGFFLLFLLLSGEKSNFSLFTEITFASLGHFVTMKFFWSIA